ncbi:ricin B lectin domain-containing protein [Mycena rebaudengoi]|nr:ricin B lectin domain-containing protein [Mycena rebaudengoi]
MISPTFVYLSAFLLSATALQIRSNNPSFSNAGIHGCVSVADNTDGAPVVISACNPDFTVQDWEFSGDPAPIKIFGDKCIGLAGGINADGTDEVQISTCTGGSDQLWTAEVDGSIRSVVAGKCLDLTDGKSIDGTQLQTATCGAANGGANSNQVWTLPDGP